MERLALRYETLAKAVNSLAEPVLLFSKNEYPELHKIIRDSLIQRFEYCYETLWQFLKDYILNIYGIETTNPTSIFKECYKAGLVNKDELESLLEMIRDRNQTSHAYHEKAAEAISKRIIKHQRLMLIIVNKFKEFQDLNATNN